MKRRLIGFAISATITTGDVAMYATQNPVKERERRPFQRKSERREEEEEEEEKEIEGIRSMMH